MTRTQDHQLVAAAAALLAADEPLPVRVCGTCMGDALPNPGRVEVRAMRRYWPGDVVVCYWVGQGFRVHRVIGGCRRRGTWNLMTQADRARRPDPAIPVHQVVGKLVGGDASRRLVEVPLPDRLWACARFFRFSVSRILRAGRR